MIYFDYPDHMPLYKDLEKRCIQSRYKCAEIAAEGVL